MDEADGEQHVAETGDAGAGETSAPWPVRMPCTSSMDTVTSSPAL
jgi:hypothetical protein